MSAPALSVQVNGGPPLSGDNLNTYAQTCDTVAELRSFVGVNGIQVYIRGTTSPADGGQGFFYWNATGTSPDDNGVTTIIPTGSVAGSGEWTRIPSSTLSGNISVGNITGGGTLSIAGTSTLTGNTSIGGTLSVTGASTLTGNTSVGGTLSVTGASTLTGNVSFGGTVSGQSTAFNNQVGTTYTLMTTDAGLTLTFNNAGSITVTLPNSLPIGFTVACIQLGAGQVGFSAAAGATLSNRSSQTHIAGQYGEVQLTVVTNSGGASAVYILAGDTA